MARRPSAKSKLPLTVTLLAAVLAIVVAAWLVFGVSPATVEDEATVPVPQAADQPAPMPNPQPATAPAP